MQFLPKALIFDLNGTMIDDMEYHNKAWFTIETFLKGAEILGVKPEDCLVLEDAPKGVEAALNAGMPCIVLSTAHNSEEFEKYSNVLKVVSDYTGPIFSELIK